MAYTKPSRDSVDFDLEGGYVAPGRGAVLVEFVEEGPQARVSVRSPLAEGRATAQSVVAARLAAASPLGAIQVYVADGTKEAQSSAPSMLGALACVSEHSVATSTSVHSPLGDATTLASDTTVPARASAGSPLGSALVEAWHIVGARPVASSPLAAPHVAARAVSHGRASARSPLGTEAIEAFQPPLARTAARTPLGSAAVLAENRFALSAAPSPLATPRGRLWHDFSVAIGPEVPVFYVCDVIAGETRRLPISSWQATVQVERQSYLQVVVPAALEHAQFLADALSASSPQIVVSRVARLSDGAEIERVMARAALQVSAISRGPARMTAVLSGFADGFVLDGEPASATDRRLASIRSISTGQGGPRIRCAIDWLLEPGLRVVYGDGESFVADWINYYVTGRDAYMDVGSRES